MYKNGYVHNFIILYAREMWCQSIFHMLANYCKFRSGYRIKDDFIFFFLWKVKIAYIQRPCHNQWKQKEYLDLNWKHISEALVHSGETFASPNYVDHDMYQCKKLTEFLTNM